MDDGARRKTLRITITPPFWNTWWARLIYAAVVIGIVCLIIQHYHKRSQEKKEKEIYEAKFEFFTNVAHEIRTPLTLIKGPVENLMEKIHELPDIKRRCEYDGKEHQPVDDADNSDTRLSPNGSQRVQP